MGAEQSGQKSSDKITIVHPAANVTTFDKEKDEQIVQLASLTRFHPILRSCLTQTPRLADDPMVRASINAQPLCDIVERLVEHMQGQSQIVAYEQAKVEKKMDHRITQIGRRLSDRKRRDEQAHTNLQKVDTLQALLSRCTEQLKSIVTLADQLNDGLPEDLRLPPIDLTSPTPTRPPTLENVTFQIDSLRLQSPDMDENIPETSVVDK